LQIIGRTASFESYDNFQIHRNFLNEEDLFQIPKARIKQKPKTVLNQLPINTMIWSSVHDSIEIRDVKAVESKLVSDRLCHADRVASGCPFADHGKVVFAFPGNTANNLSIKNIKNGHNLHQKILFESGWLKYHHPE
jgi:hypothetical protein